MGLTYLTASVANPARPAKSASVKFLVDSGATYSIVPRSVLRKLGIKARGTKTFILADGTEIERQMGDAVFSIDGETGASPVIFGEEGDSTLIGVVSLEALGLMLDPIRRVLKPLPMILGASGATKLE